MRCLPIFLIATILAQAPPSQKPAGPEPGVALELAGDYVGESYADFLSRHSKAKCVDSTTKIKNCYQWEDVSIFGLTAQPDPGCSPEKRSSAGCAQGLMASFQDQRLNNLTFALPGKDKGGVVAKLKEKYGQPTIDTTEATIWMSGKNIFSIVVGKTSEAPDAPVLITFTIGGS